MNASAFLHFKSRVFHGFVSCVEKTCKGPKLVQVGGKVGRWPQTSVCQNPLFVPLNNEGCGS